MACPDISIGYDVPTSSEDRDFMNETIANMRRLESTVYSRHDYLASPVPPSFVDASWRQRIIEWMFGVVDTCKLRRDSVAVASFYLDLCVDRGIIHSRQEFQLAAMTALQLSIKLYDSTVMKLDSMVRLGRGLFTDQDVIDMESKILTVLKWNVHPPTPVCFLRQFLRLLPATISPKARYTIGEVTRFISEISVCIYKFVRFPPSTIAYAGILIAMERINEFDLPHWQRYEIYKQMADVAGLDHMSPLIRQVAAELHDSLDQNVSIQELMVSIDVQSSQDNRFQHSSEKVKETLGRNDSSSLSHSPRDVLVSKH